jgi:hypothetical protein
MLLTTNEWTEKVKNHTALLAPFTDAFLKRRDAGKADPVHDFLFTYYNCSPSKLKQWVPSFEESLMMTPAVHADHPWLNAYWFQLDEEVLSINRDRIQENTLGIAKFIEELCRNISQRAPRYGCFGLHEWAMVYKLDKEDIRHKNRPLRIPPNELAQFVESQSISCSHYDAYRFFTKPAQPLNTLNPQIETRLQMEQGGCVHANMDIYKWAAKLWPWIGSDLIAKAFLLAVEGRVLDMRASPYDLREEGYEPICIETPEGRKQYQKEQQFYAEKAVHLRNELQAFCKRFLTSFL